MELNYQFLKDKTVADKNLQYIESRNDLVYALERGCKPKSEWRIGTEHEKFPFLTDTLERVPYEGERSIRALLEGFRDRFHWTPIMENGNIIGLLAPDGLGSISLEPGGQFELSGAPLANIHETCEEVHDHLIQVREIADPLGIGFLGLGFDPLHKLDDVHMMPKGRYKIMRDYMAKKGNLGRDMMFRSCTVQVNLDFSSEADMVKKLRTSMALQPVATALFANSPFTEGKPNGYQTFRSQIWTDTDPDRSGILPFVFEEGFGFERWVDYALDVPMYFVYRDGIYHDVSGESFRDYLEGKLPQFPGEKPTIVDWENHLTTIFPEVRIKQYMEMRGADAGPWRTLCALPAYWVGLLYDEGVLESASQLVKNWAIEDIIKLRNDVPVKGFDAQINGNSLCAIAQDTLKLSRKGLERRNSTGCKGFLETQFLNVLDEMVEKRQTQADQLLELYHNSWQGDISRVYSDFGF